MRVEGRFAVFARVLLGLLCSAACFGGDLAAASTLAGEARRTDVTASSPTRSDSAVALTPSRRTEPDLRTQHFEFYLRGVSSAAMAPLVARAESIALRVASPLGVAFPSPIRVVIAASRDAFLEALPSGVWLPESALGVAIHHERLIVLKNAAGLERTFEHEASHIALLHATAPERPPRWFIEGFAAYQAEESPLDRMDALRQASALGTLIPLRALEQHFPAGTHGTQLAYAQSNEMVTYLLGTYGEPKFRALLARIASREPFERAVAHVYGQNLDALESAYLADLRARYDWVPLMTGSAVLYALMALIFLVAYVRKRRRTRARLAAMAREDEEADAMPPPWLSPHSAEDAGWALVPAAPFEKNDTGEPPKGPAH